MPLFTSAPQSVCVLRLSAIGDVCHAVAAVQQMQQHWPDTKITWILGKVEAQLLDGLEGIEIIVFDKKAGWQGMRQVWAQLAGRRFDALLHMQLALRASLLTLGIKAKYRVGFNRQRAKEGQWLFTNRKIPDTASGHVLDSFLAFTEYLGVPIASPSWRLPLSLDDQLFAKAIVGEQPTVAICPAASKDERNWLAERYAQFADHVIEQGYQVLLCGGPTERERQLAAQIEQHMQHSARNLIGKTTLKQLAATLGQCQLVLAPDSGPAHIATTQGTPVIGLYAHSNPKRTGPYNNIANVVSVYEHFAEQQHHKPVAELPWSTRVKGADLMAHITLDEVISAFDALMSQNTPHPELDSLSTTQIPKGTPYV